MGDFGKRWRTPDRSLMAETRVRIPVAVLPEALQSRASAVVGTAECQR
jgi:hypothetical protein